MFFGSRLQQKTALKAVFGFHFFRFSKLIFSEALIYIKNKK